MPNRRSPLQAFRRALLAVAALLMIRSAAYATGDPPMLIMQAFGAVMSRSVLTYPLRAGIFQSKFAPSYVTNNSKDSSFNSGSAASSGGGFANKMSGYGMTAALTYGFTDHWGVSFLAGYTNISGDRTLSFRDNNGTLIVTPPAKVNSALNTGNSGINGVAGQGHGVVATVSGIWDYWEGDGFRLPVYLGGGIMSISEQADAAGYGVKRTADVLSPALLAGFAPSFNIWKFRAVSYFMITSALSPGTGSIVDYNPATGGVNSKTNFPLVGGLDSAFPIAGIEFTYRPWGLGFTYAPDIAGEGAQSYGLKWSREWGAGRPKP